MVRLTKDGKKFKKAKPSRKREINRVLKQVHPDVRVGLKGMKVLENMVKDIEGRVLAEAVKCMKMSKRVTFKWSDIQTAVRLVMPGELAKHAVSEGTKACAKI